VTEASGGEAALLLYLGVLATLLGYIGWNVGPAASGRHGP
jgi:drug/metabolite transporter (DMT)-like permease